MNHPSHFEKKRLNGKTINWSTNQNLPQMNQYQNHHQHSLEEREQFERKHSEEVKNHSKYYDFQLNENNHRNEVEEEGDVDIEIEEYDGLNESVIDEGRRTKGRVKIEMEYIKNKVKRFTTFSKRKSGLMKKAYELSTLTGTEVLLLVASETGHVYTFSTPSFKPMTTSREAKSLIHMCLTQKKKEGKSDENFMFNEINSNSSSSDDSSSDDQLINNNIHQFNNYNLNSTIGEN
ncbi:hypothetical protein SNEBB_003654 [Seison nebaliae]|nr:hypothetical protein SNEBB_003654 [Seison nebaliae]